jgi:hypothetical protein
VGDSVWVREAGVGESVWVREGEEGVVGRKGKGGNEQVRGLRAGLMGVH